METKELVIQIPDGMCIDESKSTFEKIVFKKKDTKSKNWEEYAKNQIISNQKGYYINELNCNIDCIRWDSCLTPNKWRNILPSKELTEAFLAMMQLMSIRQEWIGDWKPCWNGISIHFCIVHLSKGYGIDSFVLCYHVLSFPTKEMAEEFLDCFKDLLEIAKPLI